MLVLPDKIIKLSQLCRVLEAGIFGFPPYLIALGDIVYITEEKDKRNT
jgi:hypothetical protein